MLDPGAHTLSVAGERVELSSHLFSLLEVFLRHPGQVLTRELLLDSVWESGSEPSSNVVEQSVAALRRKIDAPFGRTQVVTVRGRGHRWTTRSSPD